MSKWLKISANYTTVAKETDLMSDLSTALAYRVTSHSNILCSTPPFKADTVQSRFFNSGYSMYVQYVIIFTYNACSCLWEFPN